MGFSFGGLANIIAQTRNDKIKAVVSLDGTERYQYKLLEKSPFFESKRIDVPYIHMAQKDIPEIVLKEDNIDSELNSKFQLYDSLTNSNTYKLKLHNLIHSSLEIQYFKHEYNKGKGAALRTGINKATGAYLIIQDADLEYNPKNITTFLNF
jgi:glycosyltransferase involved in cell wall biosynthesis